MNGPVIYAHAILRPGVTHAELREHCASLNAVAAELIHSDPDHRVVTHVVSGCAGDVEHAYLYLAPEATPRDAQALRSTLDEYAEAVTFRRGEPPVPLDMPDGPIPQTATA